jgi:hypothetical protein
MFSQDEHKPALRTSLRHEMRDERRTLGVKASALLPGFCPA